MTAFWRQLWILTYKNLLITLRCHWLTTPSRVLFLPIALTLFLSYARLLFLSSSEFGIAKSQPISSLSRAIAGRSDGPERVFVVNRGCGEGDIIHVIGNISSTLNGSGVIVEILSAENELRIHDYSIPGRSSSCIAAAVLYSSPSDTDGGLWNYSIRANGALETSGDNWKPPNVVQIYTLPLQHAINFTMGKVMPRPNATPKQMTISEDPFISKTNEKQSDDAQVKFMRIITNVLAGVAMIGAMSQLTSLMASERESSMVQLLETMMPNQAYWKTQVARLGSYQLAFTILYSPGWILMGIIQGLIAFRETSIIIMVTSNFLCGLSLTSMAVFIGTLFRKAHSSGVVTVVLTLILALIAQVFRDAGIWGVATMPLLFAPLNYVYTTIIVSLGEVWHIPVHLLEVPVDHASTPMLKLWLFAVLQTISYLILAAMVERLLYRTDARSRTSNVSSSRTAVDLKSISKIYKPSLMYRLFGTFAIRPPPSIHAVHDLNLQVKRGEILVLLGANESGKSTTLDAVAGLHSVSAGEIMINYPSDSQCSFGYCPQKSVLWEELTVGEHIKIFEAVKSVGGILPGAVDSLANACGLGATTSAVTKTLSGGQKRQLQIALMLAGGSSICCVDEVSPGVDSLERAMLWDIVLAERGKRTILLTTNFLNEADMLADHIAILSGGSLKAYGTPVQLKQQLGIGYRVHLYETPGDLKQPFYGDVLHNTTDEQTVYFTGTPTETRDFLRRLERDEIKNYSVEGPTLEDVFLRIEVESDGDTGDQMQESQLQQPSGKTQDAVVSRSSPVNTLQSELLYGRTPSLQPQMIALLSKRLIIFQQNSLPYLFAVAIPIIAATFATILVQDTTITSCNAEIGVESLSSILSPSTECQLVLGPNSRHASTTLAKIFQTPLGVVPCVGTISEFVNEVAKKCPYLSPGGFFLGEELTVARCADESLICDTFIQDLLANMLLKVTIVSSHEPLNIPPPDIDGLLAFSIYFCLAMAVYPAFFAMYPTIERLKGVRSMHYSNGIRLLPLWFSYLIFDVSVILPVSLISVIVFSAISNTWHCFSYLLLIFTLYGMAALLFSYLVSIFATSRLAAFAITAGVQSAIYIFMVTMIPVDVSQQNSVLNILYLTLGTISPVCSLGRALYITVNIYGAACRGRKLASYPPALDIYGEPILYLIVQSLLLFAVLIWADSRSSFKRCHSRRLMNATKTRATFDPGELKNRNGASSFNFGGLHDNKPSWMDAISKQFVWHTTLSINPRRSLVPMTHSMGEAALLASNTDILTGTMLALGTTKESRQQYGSAYVIDLVHQESPHTRAYDMEILNWWMLRHFPNAKHKGSTYHGQAQFEILADDGNGDISSGELSRIMEVAKVEVGVQYYSICRVTVD